jgi:hypothetical protein
MTKLDACLFENGPQLRGKRLASCLVVEAADGCRAVIALPELDPDLTDKEVVLVYLQDGKPLDDKATIPNRHS